MNGMLINAMRPAQHNAGSHMIDAQKKTPIATDPAIAKVAKVMM